MYHSQNLSLGTSLALLSGRPRHTWLQTVKSDLAPLNIGLATAYHRAQNRHALSILVGAATAAIGHVT